MRRIAPYEVYRALDSAQRKTYADIQNDAFIAASLVVPKIPKVVVLDDVVGSLFTLMHGGATNPGRFYPLMLELERLGFVRSEFEPGPKGSRKRVYWLADQTQLTEADFNKWLGFGK